MEVEARHRARLLRESLSSEFALIQGQHDSLAPRLIRQSHEAALHHHGMQVIQLGLREYLDMQVLTIFSLQEDLPTIGIRETNHLTSQDVLAEFQYAKFQHQQSSTVYRH